MWWWVAAACLCLGLSGFVQVFAVPWRARRTLLQAVRVLVLRVPGADDVFWPLSQQPDIARGISGWHAVPPIVFFFVSAVCAPVVGNTAALIARHGVGYGASWSEVYPAPGRWIAGALLFAILASGAASALCLQFHLHGWGIRLGPVGVLGWVVFVPVLGVWAWGYESATGVDGRVAAVAVIAAAAGMAWSGNRAVWAAYADLSLDLEQPSTRTVRVTAAGLVRSRLAARIVVWGLVLAVSFVGALVASFEGNVLTLGPELAVAVPAIVLAASVVKDLAADAGRGVGDRHGLTFRE
jgi:hypothetical protein